MRAFKTISGVLTLLALLISTSPIKAQSPIKAGITGGLNIANMNDTDADDLENRFGFRGGVFAKFKIPATPMAIQPELVYTQKGFDVDNGTAKLDYIEIPVLAKFGFITPGPVNPEVFFGPYMAFNMNAEAAGDNITINVEDAVNKTEFGVTVGAGVDIGRFNVGGRYSAGLTNVFDDDSGTDGKNGVFSIVTSVAF